VVLTSYVSVRFLAQFTSYSYSHAVQDGSAPYCSPECINRDQPAPSASSSTPLHVHMNPSSLHTLSDTDNDVDLSYHDIYDVPNKEHLETSDRAGIQAWAANVPYGCSDGTPSPDISRTSSRANSPQPSRTPKLLLCQRLPVAPSLCMSTPQPACPHPSRPILTPQQSIASLNLAKSTGDVGSLSMTSLLSGITESLIATPSSASIADPSSSDQEHACKPRVFEAFATLRSWVPSFSQPQSKCVISARPSKHHTESTSLKINGLSPSKALHYNENDTSTWIASDDCAAHNVWWKSEGSVVGKKRKAPENRQPPRGSRHLVGCAQSRDDHPAYRARGRKMSRAIA
jgi:hypothetical protein